MRWLILPLILFGCAAHHPAQIVPQPKPKPDPVPYVTWYVARQQYMDLMEMSAPFCHSGGWDLDRTQRLLDMMRIEVQYLAFDAQPYIDPEQWNELAENQRIEEESWEERATPGPVELPDDPPSRE